MACEDEATLLRFVQGRLGATDAARVQRHLDGCADCRKLTAVAADAADDAGPDTASLPTVDNNPGGPGTANPDLKASDLIGRYQLLERVGSGGMGVVWAAYDPQLHRKIALKLIRRTLDPATDKRILREAQAMARLSHPNVVTVFDAGTWPGGFFIAMELVDGLTLRKWRAVEPRAPREVVAMLVAAGRGLAAAHAVGLVHRDFKPDNVFVANDGKVRVGDFGLVTLAPGQQSRGGATPLQARLTEHGTLLGTPGFLAPELLGDGVPTPASDQFSFCVTAYECLYRVGPFKGDSMIDLAVAAKEGRLQPPPPGTRVPRRLFDLLARGLHSEPNARFPTLDALLVELADDPTRRRRTWAVSATATVLLVGAFGAATWVRRTACAGLAAELTQAWSPTRERAAAAAFAATGRPYAAESWSRTRERLQRWADGWVVARTEACAARGALDDAQYRARLDCLAERRDELGALVGAFETADATVLSYAGTAVAELSPVDSCRRAAAGRVPAPPELRAGLLRVRTLLYTGQHPKAAEAALPVYEAARALQSPLLIADAARMLGEAQHSVGQEACLETWREGARAAAEAGDDELTLRLLAHLIGELGWQRGKPDEARALAPVAEGIARRLVGHDRAIGRMVAAQGDVEWQAGKPEAALVLYRRALEHFEREPGPDSLDAARSHAEIGWELMELGQLPAARAAIERSRAIREQVYGPSSPALFSVLAYLGAVTREQGDLSAAARVAEQALALAELDSAGSGLLAPLLSLAQLYGELGRGEEGLKLIDRADALLAADPTKAHRRPEALGARESVERALGHHEKALAAGLAALAAARETLSADHPIRVDLFYELARTHLEAGRPADALKAAAEGLKLQDAARVSRGPVRARLLSVSGRAALSAGQPTKALPVLERSVELFDAVPTYDPNECGTARLALADAQWKTGRTEAAAKTATAARGQLPQAADDWLAAHPSAKVPSP